MSPDTSTSLFEMSSDFVFICVNIGLHQAPIPSMPFADAVLGGSMTASLAALLTIAAQSLVRYDPSSTSCALPTAALSASAFVLVVLAGAAAPGSVAAGAFGEQASDSRASGARVFIMSAS